MIPAVGAFIKANKNRRAAKKANAEIDITAEANRLIIAAEQSFKDLDAVMKAQGSSAGETKKNSVLAGLKAYSETKGYTFDLEYWSGKVDELVAFTKNVNRN